MPHLEKVAHIYINQTNLVAVFREGRGKMVVLLVVRPEVIIMAVMVETGHIYLTIPQHLEFVAAVVVEVYLLQPEKVELVAAVMRILRV